MTSHDLNIYTPLPPDLHPIARETGMDRRRKARENVFRFGLSIGIASLIVITNLHMGERSR